MPDSPASISLRDVLVSLITAIVTLTPKWVELYRNWKKPDLDNRESEARAVLAHESARSLRIRDEAATGEAVGKMLNSLIEAGDTFREMEDKFRIRLDSSQATIDRLRAERDGWQEEYDKVFVERDHLLIVNAKLQGEVKSYEEQIERMAATLKLNGLNYDNTQNEEVAPLD